MLKNACQGQTICLLSYFATFIKYIQAVFNSVPRRTIIEQLMPKLVHNLVNQ
jgi:hypothetical protein